MKHDKTKTKAVIKMLDAASRKYGMVEVRHAANRWANAQREKAALIRQRAVLEKQLAEVSSRIKT